MGTRVHACLLVVQAGLMTVVLKMDVGIEFECRTLIDLSAIKSRGVFSWKPSLAH